MLNHVISDGNSWGIDINKDRNRLLIQLNENCEFVGFCEQVKLALTREEVEQLLEKLTCTLDFIKD